MRVPSQFALLRPELQASLERGALAIASLMSGDTRIVRAGEILIEPDTDHEYVYRLREGWVARTRVLSDGREQCILIFLPGDLFAVKSMFVNRHTDAVRALSKVRVERIHRRKLHEVFAQNVDVANLCTWQVMEEERRLHSWVVGLGQGSAEERLAFLLIELRGRLVTAGAIASEAQSFDIPLTQAQLAEHIGITSVHVNRVLKTFRDRHLANVCDGLVEIQDLNGLARLSRPLLDSYENVRPEYVGAPGAGARGVDTPGKSQHDHRP